VRSAGKSTRSCFDRPRNRSGPGYRPPLFFLSGGGGELFSDREPLFEPDDEVDLPEDCAPAELLPDGCDRVAGCDFEAPWEPCDGCDRTAGGDGCDRWEPCDGRDWTDGGFGCAGCDRCEPWGGCDFTVGG
jgi:hypothetical protein